MAAGNGEDNGGQLPPRIESQLGCASCGQPFAVRMDEPCIANFYSTSLVAFTHERPVRCPKCGQHYQMRVRGFQGIMYEWIPVPAPPKEGRILIPKGVILPQ